MYRNGYAEETYVTFSYSPIPDDDGSFGGILCPVTEETQRIIDERRLALLRELAARTTDARTWQEACKRAASALETNPTDLPFALIYMIDPKNRSASLAGASGISPGNKAAPKVISSYSAPLWPIEEVFRNRCACLISNLTDISDELPLVLGQYPITQAVVMPIIPSGETGMAGVLVVGLNPLRLYDDSYQSFLELVAGEISAAITNGQAYEAERRRAEALAELDRAKTAFFSNVSHEFRTPLTLMLVPLEEILSKNEDLSLYDREQLSLVHRNSQRLLKLVNTLLDFSRIEAGRIQAVYEPIDLSAFTTELASVFRSTIEKAGLRLNVDCPTLPEPIYVDKEMWEKIILNLLSNAFKFTFEGEITVSLRWCRDHIELMVRDTGTGITPEEMPYLFERFHRIKGAKSRTYEGTGIGLALVQELVKLHGGNIKTQSKLGVGTTFIVSIPTGHTHLPADRINAIRVLTSTSIGVAPYVEEAMRLIPEGICSDSDMGSKNYPAYIPADGTKARVLLADDNADMRGYIHRLLAGHYEVEAVADGSAALDAVLKNPPDLVLTDIMMPIMDGFELLRALRADSKTRSIPVIFLSARAGEESKVEGMEAGADDYLVKPFSARELMARIAAHLQMAQVRREAALKERKLRNELERELEDRIRAEEALRESEESFRALVTASSEILYRMSPDWSKMNKLCGRGFLADTENPSSNWIQEYILPEDQPHVCAVIKGAIRKKTVFELEHRVQKADGNVGWVLSRAVPLLNANGEIVEWFGAASDVTDRKLAEETLKKAYDILEEKVNERTAELKIAYNSLKEIETVRKQEIHHRIKNNLQVISSLLDLQAEKFNGKNSIKNSEVLEAFKESQDRVISMALVHEELHKGGKADTINFSQYIEELADHLFLTYRFGNDAISLDMNIEEDIFFDMDTAVPLGIIVNELISNSLKHAFPYEDKGEIQIELHREENEKCENEDCKSTSYVLSVSDNGIGIPENLEIEDLDSLGIQLVTTLVDQLDGELELRRGNGTEFIVRFSLSERYDQESSQTPQLIE